MMIILKSLRLRRPVQKTAEEKELPEETKLPVFPEQNIGTAAEEDPLSAEPVFTEENSAAVMPEFPEFPEFPEAPGGSQMESVMPPDPSRVLPDTEEGDPSITAAEEIPEAEKIAYSPEIPAVMRQDLPESSEAPEMPQKEPVLQLRESVLMPDESVSAQKVHVLPQKLRTLPEGRDENVFSAAKTEEELLREEQYLFPPDKSSGDASVFSLRESGKEEMRLPHGQQDILPSSGVSQYLPVLEKICSTLEQIAGFADECSRKLDSDEENTLNYN